MYEKHKMTPELKTKATEGDVEAQTTWLMDEINEFKAEAKLSKQYYDEFLDVLGLLFKFKSPDLSKIVVKEVSNFPDLPALTKAYTPWKIKNESKGREPIAWKDLETIYTSMTS